MVVLEIKAFNALQARNVAGFINLKMGYVKFLKWFRSECSIYELILNRF